MGQGDMVALDSKIEDLEQELREATDPDRKKKIRRQLKSLRQERAARRGQSDVS